jgi:beta-glucosidase
MPSFSSVDWTEDGVGNPIKMHANKELITGRSRKIGFDGFVISDWEGIHQIPDPSGAPAPQPAAGPDRRQRRHRHVHGAEHVPQFEQVLKAEVTGRAGEPWPGSTTRCAGS